jgi:thiol-disulfide isomerase/thioredoxin
LSAAVVGAGSRAAAPTFSLKDAKGNPVNLPGHKGSVVLLDFWGTTCELCKIEMPWFMEFQKKYKSEGLSVVGVATDDNSAKVTKYLLKEPVSYRIAVGDGKIEKA